MSRLYPCSWSGRWLFHLTRRMSSQNASAKFRTCLSPDLWTCGRVVTITIRPVIKLIRPETILVLFSIATRLERADRVPVEGDLRRTTNVMIVVIRIAVGNNGNGCHFSAENTKNVDLLLNDRRWRTKEFAVYRSLAFDWLFGMKMTHFNPKALQRWARPMPVFPAVPSTIVAPGRIRSEPREKRRRSASEVNEEHFFSSHLRSGRTLLDLWSIHLDWETPLWREFHNLKVSLEGDRHVLSSGTMSLPVSLLSLGRRMSGVLRRPEMKHELTFDLDLLGDSSTKAF